MLEEEESNPLGEACTEFGTYLNVSGAAEAASNALLALFLLDAKPENAVEFVRETLDKKINKELARLKEKVECARDEVQLLKDEILEMRKLGLKLITEESEETSADGESEEQIHNDENADGGEQADDKLETELLASLGPIESDEKIDSANVEDENK